MTLLNEYAQRILSELEEAGQENVFAMLNTIIEPGGAEAEVEGFKELLSLLMDRGLITLGMSAFGRRTSKELEPRESPNLNAELQRWFRFDNRRNIWTLKDGILPSTSIPEIYLTPEGRQMSEAILVARGYQWWRPNNS